MLRLSVTHTHHYSILWLTEICLISPCAVWTNTTHTHTQETHPQERGKRRINKAFSSAERGIEAEEVRGGGLDRLASWSISHRLCSDEEAWQLFVACRQLWVVWGTSWTLSIQGWAAVTPGWCPAGLTSLLSAELHSGFVVHGDDAGPQSCIPTLAGRCRTHKLRLRSWIQTQTTAWSSV